MRLLNCRTLGFNEIVDPSSIQYAILSHRWTDDEVSYQDMIGRQRNLDCSSKAGYKKIEAFCKIALENSLEWAWVDTCCINKDSSAELSEVINSMYKWYKQSTVCIAYLYDYRSGSHPENATDQLCEQLGKSSWFYRGWTLQELISPRRLIFYDCDWVMFDDKDDLANVVSKITRIPVGVLNDARHHRTLTVAEKMAWASNRKCTHEEDVAYSLMGLFEVNMPLLYGEGKKAFIRLQEEIIKSKHDHTIFLWKCTKDSPRSMLASAPSDFADTTSYNTFYSLYQPYSFTHAGLLMTAEIKPFIPNVYIVELECMPMNPYSPRTGIYLKWLGRCHTGKRDRFQRLIVSNQAFDSFGTAERTYTRTREIYIDMEIIETQEMDRDLYGFHIKSLKVKRLTGREKVSDILLSKHVKINQRRGSWDPVKRIIELDPGYSGTVCVICFENRCLGPITALRLGFDWEFRPVCVVTIDRNVLNEKWSTCADQETWASEASEHENVKSMPFRDISCFESSGWTAWDSLGWSSPRSSNLLLPKLSSLSDDAWHLKCSRTSPSLYRYETSWMRDSVFVASGKIVDGDRCFDVEIVFTQNEYDDHSHEWHFSLEVHESKTSQTSKTQGNKKRRLHE